MDRAYEIVTSGIIEHHLQSVFCMLPVYKLVIPGSLYGWLKQTEDAISFWETAVEREIREIDGIDTTKLISVRETIADYKKRLSELKKEHLRERFEMIEF